MSIQLCDRKLGVVKDNINVIMCVLKKKEQKTEQLLSRVVRQ